MKTKHLVIVLLGLATLSLFAADASAMYNPATGTFMQRDPGPDGTMTAPRVAGGTAIGGGFIQRDPSNTPLPAVLGRTIPARDLKEQKKDDGANLYQYTASNPTNRMDPDGLVSIQINWMYVVPVTPQINVTHVAPSTPAYNTPPGPACNAYCCSWWLKTICNNAGTGCWNNCVRGCLLADWNCKTCDYNSGIRTAHIACWNYCTVKCTGVVAWSGNGPAPSNPPPPY